MKNSPLVKFAFLSAPLCLSTALAQDEENEDGFRVNPVEAYTCNYNEGKGPDDLQDAIDFWNEWMDEQGHMDYFAIVATPQYYGELKMDFGWLGATETGEQMGAGTDDFMNDGGDVGMKFAAAINCPSHTNFANANIKPPPDDVPPDTMVLSFSNCTVAEGVQFEDALDGLDQWAAYQTEQAYKNGTWIMFPAWGESALADYDFKVVHSYADHTSMGKAWDLYGNGGGWQKYGAVLGDILDCDSPRVYDARVVRRIPVDE